jgi:hypothetical protein
MNKLKRLSLRIVEQGSGLAVIPYQQGEPEQLNLMLIDWRRSL